VHRVKIQAGMMVIWTSRYAPFFGREELAMLDAWGKFVDLAMERSAYADRQRTFIAHAAHELRTPLTTILGVSSTLARRWHELTPEMIEEFGESLDRQGDRAVRLITNLLDLAQLDSGRLPTAIEPVSLSAAAKRALLLAPPPEGTRVEVEVDTRVRAAADPERLEQILVNLLVNAYRYGSADVRIESRVEHETVVLVVSDGGPGVQEDVLPYLFEPFVRAPGTRHPGSGLGLAISRRLAEAFGGMMWYTPGSPRGACFNVRLRRAA
jgi:signal transduction histidine kinase